MIERTIDLAGNETGVIQKALMLPGDLFTTIRGNSPVETAMDHSRVLTEFMRGQVGFAELTAALQSVISLDYDDPSHRAVTFKATWRVPAIVFSRKDVCRAIDQFLRFEITDEELSNWAATIRLLDNCFDLESKDENADAVWDVLDRLMAPTVWGEIDRESMEQLSIALGCRT